MKCVPQYRCGVVYVFRVLIVGWVCLLCADVRVSLARRPSFSWRSGNLTTIPGSAKWQNQASIYACCGLLSKALAPTALSGQP